MIKIQGLHFAYSQARFQIQIPDLQLDAEQTLAIVGPSGSGKTTFLNLISGLLRPDAGSIDFQGQDLAQASARQLQRFRASKIGFVFQDFQLAPYLSAFDNILLPIRLKGAWPTKSDKDRAQDLADQAGIADRLTNKPARLSQGEKQRVAICRALINKPALILADEATGNLDPENKHIILELMFATAREHGAGLIAVTHDHELLSRFDRTISFSDFRKDREAA